MMMVAIMCYYLILLLSILIFSEAFSTIGRPILNIGPRDCGATYHQIAPLLLGRPLRGETASNSLKFETLSPVSSPKHSAYWSKVNIKILRSSAMCGVGFFISALLSKLIAMVFLSVIVLTDDPHANVNYLQ